MDEHGFLPLFLEDPSQFWEEHGRWSRTFGPSGCTTFERRPGNRPVLDADGRLGVALAEGLAGEIQRRLVRCLVSG